MLWPNCAAHSTNRKDQIQKSRWGNLAEIHGDGLYGPVLPQIPFNLSLFQTIHTDLCHENQPFQTLIIPNIYPAVVISVQTEHHDSFFYFIIGMQFIFPTPLHYGWGCYLLNMLKKKIVVIDSPAGPFGFSTVRVKFHEQISHTIHVAFFRCVESLFSSWPCTSNRWTREFPILMVEKITRYFLKLYQIQ